MRGLPRLTAVAFALVLAACGSKSQPAAQTEPDPEPASDTRTCTGADCDLACDRECADQCMADEYQVPCIEDCGCNPDEVLNADDPDDDVEE